MVSDGKGVAPAGIRILGARCKAENLKHYRELATDAGDAVRVFDLSRSPGRVRNVQIRTDGAIQP